MRERAAAIRTASTGATALKATPDEAGNVSSATEKAATADALEEAAAAVDKQAKEVEADSPYISFGPKENWSLSYTAFVGLLRVTPKSKTGTADKFEPLSGAGTGLKVTCTTSDNNGKRIELVGFGAGFYFEPKIKVSGQDSTAQALSAIITVSALSKFYVGLTYKFISNEPAFSRGNGGENIGLVFGGGFDGLML